MQVIQIVPQGAAQQELHAEIIDLLGAGFLCLFFAFIAAPNHQIPQNKRHSFIVLLIGSIFGADTEIVRKLLLDQGFDLRHRQIIVHKIETSMWIYLNGNSSSRRPVTPVL